jgi:hypothetical protein
MIGDPYEDRPASHAVYHATGEGERCLCHGKTEVELAMPYALFSFGLPLIVVVILLIAVVVSR